MKWHDDPNPDKFIVYNNSPYAKLFPDPTGERWKVVGYHLGQGFSQAFSIDFYGANSGHYIFFHRENAVYEPQALRYKQLMAQRPHFP